MLLTSVVPGVFVALDLFPNEFALQSALPKIHEQLTQRLPQEERIFGRAFGGWTWFLPCGVSSGGPAVQDCASDT